MTQNAINNAASTLTVGTSTTTNNISVVRSAEGQWLGMDDQTDVFGVYNSTGTPEGGVTANIGSICTDTTNGALYIKQTDSTNTGWAPVGGNTGMIVQTSESTIATALLTAVNIPFDNTIPQITEGAQVMTHAFTPQDASNNLRIECISWATNGANQNCTLAIFAQGTANAIAAVDIIGAGASIASGAYCTATMVAGVTTAITFEARFGPDGGVNSRLSGSIGAGHKYGAAGITTLRVTEFLP